MVKHVIVDGSNIATEGRSKPSLKQLNEAVLAFLEEHPKAAVTVIVDATFGHRIDPKEFPAFNKAIEHNELVTPPAGTVGRGDAFVLSIAEKAGAAILSNDSYQEFHGQYKWLFDEGRLIGGKPVPHVGWVFVERLPVRGEKSRLSERKSKSAGSERPSRKVSAAALKPMPVPKSPPPGATLPARKADSSSQNSRKGDSGKGINGIIPFLHFVESHAVGSVVEGVVESYSSHGAYVQIGDIRGYVPLRLIGNPPPRSAREAMKLGEKMSLEIAEIIAERRSVNLRPASSRSGKTAVKRAAPTGRSTSAPGAKLIAKKAAPVKKAVVKKAPAAKKAAVKKPASVKKTAVKKTAVKKAPAVKKALAKKAASKPAVSAKKTAAKRAALGKTPAKKSPGTSSKKAPTKRG